MINSIIIHTNKVLKITNVCIIEFNIQKDDINFLISKMENYIKSKGATPIGPLIQKTEYSVNEEGQLDIKVYL